MFFYIFLGDINYSKKLKILHFFKIVAPIFVYSAKNKNRRGNQIPSKESSICGKKRTQILFGYNIVWPRNYQLKQRSDKL